MRALSVVDEKIAASCSDITWSQNREDIVMALEMGICSAEKIKYLGNGIDLKDFDPQRFDEKKLKEKRSELGIPPDGVIVGFVGRLAGKRKGFMDFLKAGRELVTKNQNAFFLIVGKADSGKPDAVEPSKARRYGMEERCLFLGQIPNDELPILYKIMDVLVLPSSFEGVPGHDGNICYGYTSCCNRCKREP